MTEWGEILLKNVKRRDLLGFVGGECRVRRATGIEGRPPVYTL